MRFVLILTLIIMFSAIKCTQAQEWTLKPTKNAVISSNSPITIEYTNPSKVSWTECSYTLPIPSAPGNVYLELKSSAPGTLIIVLESSDGIKAFYHFKAPLFRAEAKINSFSPDMTQGGIILSDIKSVSLCYNSDSCKPGEKITTQIYNIRFETAVPEKTQWNKNWLPSIGTGIIKDYDAESCVWNVWPYSSGPGWESGQAEFGGYNSEKGKAIIRSVIDFFADNYGHGALDLPYVEDKELVAYASSRNVKIYAEMHNTPEIKWLKENRALNINKWGTTCLDMGIADTNHAYDFTDDRVLEKVSEKMLKSAAAGVKYIRTVDYVWTPFGPNGSWNAKIWGYSAAAIQRWREDLLGTDTGIEISGRSEPLYFHEYFKDYHGYDIIPQYTGFEDWRDYVPPMDSDKDCIIEKDKLHNMLIHYEWLKFINRAVEPCVKKYGVYAQPILNCESGGNGGDYIYLSKLSNIAGYCPEWWGSHNVILGTYYNGRYFEAGAQGKEIGLFGESGAAGGNPFYGKYQKPNYWDNPANCLITYSQAGSVNFKSKQDQYWGSHASRMQNPEEKEYLLYTAFVSAWNGFLRAKEDKLTKPKSNIIAFIQRAPAGYTNTADASVSAPYALNGILEKNNYLFDGASLPNTLNMKDYDICIYNPITGPQGALNDIYKWLSSGNKTLITHSFIPINTDKPGKDVNKIDTDITVPKIQRKAAKAMGFDTIKETDVSHGVFSTELPELKKFEGEFYFETPVRAIEGYEPLAYIGDTPVISQKRFGNGSRIIYMGFTPSMSGDAGANTKITVNDNAQAAEFDSAVINALMNMLNIKQQGITDDDIAVLRYKTEKRGDVYILSNRSACTKWQGEEEIFNVFQAESPNVTYSAPVQVLTDKPNTQYIIRDVLKGDEIIAESDSSGYLAVDMNGYNMRGIYVYPADK